MNIRQSRAQDNNCTMNHLAQKMKQNTILGLKEPDKIYGVLRNEHRNSQFHYLHEQKPCFIILLIRKP